MCGFFQVIQKKSPIDKRLFRQALASMRHRGPDQSGEMFLENDVQRSDSKQTVYMGFGHQRLSIQDISNKSNQPFVMGSDVLIYNGEVYNFRELNEELRINGEVLDTEGDTETLFRCIRSDGEKALSRFNGMWAFSLYFASKDCLFLSRDRYGKKPLFFYRDENLLCVSSTIFAIQIYLQKKLQFRRDALIENLIYGKLYPSGTTDTHFEGISQVLPGHWASFDLTSWEICQKSYFKFHDERLTGHVEYNPELLAETLKDSVRKRLISDRPVGLLLSGGIDSTLILSTLFSLGLQDQCQIYMGNTGKSEDYNYAKQCVEHLGFRAETVTLDYNSSTFDRFLKICRHMEKPVALNGSSMAMPQMYEVIASKGVPVVLDGTGGDEIFGGYWSRQGPYAVREAVKQNDWEWIRKQLKSKDAYPIKSYLMRAYVPTFFSEKNYMAERKLKAFLNPCFKPELKSIFLASPTDPLEKMGQTFTEAISSDVAPGGRLGEWLWHNDRNSMMSSVEGRSPLLDYRLNRFSYTSYNEKFSTVWNKFELRRIFDALTPLPSQWRQQKQGFRWDSRKFLYSNKEKILELIRENKSSQDLIDISKFVAVADRHPKLLSSSFGRQLLAISAIDHVFSSS